MTESNAAPSKIKFTLGVAAFMLGEIFILASIVLILRATVINPYDISRTLLVPAGAGIVFAVVGILTFGPFNLKLKPRTA